MRNSKLAVFVVLLCMSLGYGTRVEAIRANDSAGPAGNEFQTETEWIKFTSPEGRFSVLLPHEPKFQEVAATETSGITNYRYSDLESGYGFICEYFDVTSIGASQQDFLDVTRDGIVRGAGAAKVGEEKISLNSYPGRELQMAFTVNEGTQITARTRIYLVDKRLYSLTFLHVKSMDALLASDIGKKFFSSFELKAR